MDSLPISPLDLAIAAVLLVSGGIAFFRGFVHEVLAVAAWVGAVFVTIYGLPLLQPFARAQISLTLAADIAAGAMLFLASLLIFSILTKAISKQVRESALNSVDSSLGFVFGLGRGAVIVSLAYMLGVWVLGSDTPPGWLADAKARPWMERGAGLIRGLLPSDLAQAESATRKTAEDAKNLIEMERAYRNLASPSPAKTEPAADQSGYGASERRDMDRLFQSNQ